MLVGYARVSTGEQNLDLQIDALKSAHCDEIFTDEISGAKSERPGLSEALAFLRDGDTLVVWKLDRFGRSLKDLVLKVEELKQRGIYFVSLTENIDTTSPTGKLQFHIFSALAEFERDIIRERTMAGLRSARARGRFGGRPKTMTDEKLDRASKLMKSSDCSITEICEMVGMSRSSLYRYLKPDGTLRSL
jgi:DNA invertase Pin-like site-specific DNA recombinase